MAHRRPTVVENHGDAKRLSIALGAFIVELLTDRRVLAWYDIWRSARAPTDREFEFLLAEHPETIDLFIADVTFRDHGTTAPFVRTWLHRLPAAWTDMVTANLLLAFRTTHYHGRTRADSPPARRPKAPPQFGIGVELTAAHKRGKVPHAPDTVQRGIRWLYRAYVPERPDSKHQLAREYAVWAQRDDPEDCIHDVKEGIRQAWALLDLGAASVWAPEKPGRIVVPPPTKKDNGE